jgi:hypothetical protein
MPAIGIGVVWFGYSLSLWGYCIVRGYNVKFTDLINPVHFYSGSWPPPLMPPNQILPGQTLAANPTTSTTSTPTTTNIAKGQVAGANPAIVNVAGRGK